YWCSFARAGAWYETCREAETNNKTRSNEWFYLLVYQKKYGEIADQQLIGKYVDEELERNLVLVLDMEVAKLTNIQAFEAPQIVGISVDAHIETELPRSLAEIVWYIYTFQLKLENFNFTSKHQNLHHFSRFSLARACICASLCCAKVSEAVQPEVVANRSYAKVNKTCCVTEAPSIFDGSLAGRTSSCCFGRRNHVWNESTMRT
ncbi:hypothetical protein HID58_023820, partial [Brassica napus]